MKFLSQINVNSEYTLPIVDGTNGQVLTTDGNGAVYWSSSVGATNLNALTDVELTSPSTGQILRYEIPLGGSVPVWRNVTPGYLDPNSSINALGDVTITSAVAGQILQFNGTFWINTTLSTVEYVSKVQHTVKAGVAITKGQAVYVTTSAGTNMIVGLASNAAESTSSKVIGLAASNAAINDQIFVVTEGLIAGLNTSTATAGDPVWLGTNGNLIFGLLNKPVAPAHLVYIGVVTRAQQNNGEIFVNVQNGFELNEIHDALITSPTAGQLLRRDSDNLWKNWTPNYLTAHPTIANGGSVDNSNGTVIQDITLETNGHVTAITSVDLDTRYYTQNDISGIFGGEIPMAGYNPTNWDTAYNNTVTGISFSTSTGVLTLTQQDTGTLTVDLDGRYIQSETDTLATVTGRGNTTTTHIGVTTSSPINLATAGNIGTWIGGIQDGTSGWSITNNGIGFKADNTTYAGIVLAPGNGILYFGRTSAGGVGTMNSWLEVNSSGVANFKQARPQHNGSNLALFSEIPTNLNQLVNGPGYITGYTETDTLASVTGRGATTTNAITVGGLIVDTNTLVVDATNDRVGIGRTSPLYKIDVAGNARFDNELYVGGVWSTSYGPRTAGGNIHFHDWSGNVRARINTVAGVTSVGNRKLSLGILDINSQGTPEIKINTKIPFALGGADFTVNIKGFQYGGTNMVSLSIGWHYYLSQFYNETAISNGSFSPTITLGVEPEGDYAGCVVIHLSNVGYWPKLYVESVYSSAYADDYVANWSWSDVGIDGLTSTTVVPYKPLETSITGNAAYATNAGNSITTSQTNFTTLTLSNAAVATQAWVQAQGYLTSLPSHNHDDRYYTESEIDSQISSRLYQAAQSSLDVNAFNGTGLYRGSTSSWTNRPTVVHNGGALLQIDTHPGSYHSQLFFDTGGDRLYFRNANAGSWGSWLTFIHSGNIGSQSVLYATSAGNADTVDSLHASSFLRSDTYNSNYGGLQVFRNIGTIDGSWPDSDHTLSLENGDAGNIVLNFHRAGYTSNNLRYNGSNFRFDLALESTGVITASGGNSTNWNAAYGWGNHADAPYWNVSLTDAVQVEAQEVIFAGNVTIQGTLTESSSIRFKENIVSLEPSLDKVNQLEAVSYNKIGVDDREIGLIAEDVAELFPEVVTYNDEGQPQGIQYQRLSVILLKAVQELTERVNKLENK